MFQIEVTKNYMFHTKNNGGNEKSRNDIANAKIQRVGLAVTDPNSANQLPPNMSFL